MHSFTRIATAAAALAVTAPAVSAQEEQAGQARYFRAVAQYFRMSSSEVSILGEWRLPPEEIPVVLFVAHRAGISPEALVALRRSGRGWGELAGRYQLDASHFHVPLPESTAGARLRSAYEQFRALPAPRWSQITLGDREIVDLVNVRVVSQTLGMAPQDVLRAASAGTSWDVVYVRLLGGSTPRIPDDGA